MVNISFIIELHISNYSKLFRWADTLKHTKFQNAELNHTYVPYLMRLPGEGTETN